MVHEAVGLRAERDGQRVRDRHRDREAATTTMRCGGRVQGEGRRTSGHDGSSRRRESCGVVMSRSKRRWGGMGRSDGVAVEHGDGKGKGKRGGKQAGRQAGLSSEVRGERTGQRKGALGRVGDGRCQSGQPAACVPGNGHRLKGPVCGRRKGGFCAVVFVLAFGCGERGGGRLGGWPWRTSAFCGACSTAVLNASSIYTMPEPWPRGEARQSPARSDTGRKPTTWVDRAGLKILIAGDGGGRWRPCQKPFISHLTAKWYSRCDSGTACEFDLGCACRDWTDDLIPELPDSA
jgi:hypothetical protein